MLQYFEDAKKKIMSMTNCSSQNDQVLYQFESLNSSFGLLIEKLRIKEIADLIALRKGLEKKIPKD